MNKRHDFHRPKIGDKTLGASLRLGLAELRHAASLGGNVEQPTPYGMYGNPTLGDVQGWHGSSPGGSHTYQRMSDAGHHLPTPSQVIDNPQPYRPEPGQTQTQTKEQGNAASLPTPSQVIDNPTAHRPEPQHGREQQQEHGREM